MTVTHVLRCRAVGYFFDHQEGERWLVSQLALEQRETGHASFSHEVCPRAYGFQEVIKIIICAA